MQTEELYYLHILNESFLARQRKNPSYSLRAFAKDLSIDSSNLSAILRNKRGLPLKRAEFISRKLKLSPKESALFNASALRKSTRLDSIRVSHETKKYLIDEKYHKIISEWEYYAFLQLMKVRGFKSEIAWIAKRLQISSLRAGRVIQELTELGFIRPEEKSGYIRLTPRLETSEDVASRALHDSHADSLEIAKVKLESIPVLLRDFSSVTMAINTQKLPQAKALIREFQDRLQALCGEEDRDEVYLFASQFFPLTQGVTL